MMAIRKHLDNKILLNLSRSGSILRFVNNKKISMHGLFIVTTEKARVNKYLNYLKTSLMCPSQ